MLPSLSDVGDDPEKFFRRPVFEVSSADLWRWHACRVALRDMISKPNTKD